MHSSGITYQDVEQAADAVVGRGEKPTIARVRAEIDVAVLTRSMST
ncbi:DNA-binding protein [Halomonas sp. TBZ9]|uniref:DNA-binding protein n=1 Tax=Vreelandella azerica TaxID=2732867 RepID=A0A7Y3U298_9GAMM|nr:DNA-binding protein [Halomonas azerica]NOG32914.1 DNA-binding protein [Halomonas azerica]